MSVQQSIIRGIKEQLFFNDYLVLPNFGGFVLKSRAAHISVSGGLLLPPSKTVSFNAQLKQNDGILSSWLQNALKCTAIEATAHLNDFSEFCSGILTAKRRLSIEGIGFFYLDFENNICFEPQQDSNFLSSSFGLGAVSIKELENKVVEPKKETVFVDRVKHTEEPTSPLLLLPKTKRSYGKMVTPLLIAILFVSVLGLLVNNFPVNGELRSSLFGSESKRSYVALSYPELKLQNNTVNASTYVADANGIANIELENSKKIAVNVFNNSNNSTDLNRLNSVKYTSVKSGKYEIVLGCFTVLQNAKRMIKKLSKQKVNAEVTGQNNKGMYVVSNGSYSTKDEAIERLQELKDRFPHAWIKSGE
ncbi:SPOR domain-containing protein [Aurantibacillus circumpalustris]|uniref:HU domain-containing protein n=1 Tax=Aurantibacillus circumpalustris TaxID=3036359 RepID=UPI00295C22A6|nr:SPOR domain-containing protein [Aurantibacillus circumpalustris]